jgi:hypothetical protein
VEWRNALFERCSPQTMMRLPDAQIHVPPRGLGRGVSRSERTR